MQMEIKQGDDVAPVSTMKLSKGDRVKLSGEGLAKLPRPHHPRTVDRPDRRGTITSISRTGASIRVLWDDRKTTESLYASFLEHDADVTETVL